VDIHNQVPVLSTKAGLTTAINTVLYVSDLKFIFGISHSDTDVFHRILIQKDIFENSISTSNTAEINGRSIRATVHPNILS